MTPQLILAPTIHRAKQLEKDLQNPLSRSLTIDRFVKALYERHGTKRSIDQLEAKYILASRLEDLSLDHFDYLTPQSESIQEMSDLFIALKRNDVSVDKLGHVKIKTTESQALFERYDAFLKAHDLCDLGDVESEMAELLRHDKDAAKVFGELYIDDFESNGVHFESSKQQKEILRLLVKNGGKPCPRQTETRQSARLFEPSPAPFDQIDEVASALKIARKLLDDGTSADEIIIVTTAIDEYAAIFESQLELYGLKGYSSKGTPLRHFLPQIKDSKSGDERLSLAKERYDQLKDTAKQTQARLGRMGLKVTLEALLEATLDQTTIRPRTHEGIMLTEPNQLLSLQHIKHLVFMGTDMSHFPPKASESFLVTQKQRESLLHANSVYLSSQNHYLHMKAIAENLYIVTATFKGKTRLARSLMITEPCEAFDISDYQAQHELLREHKRISNSEMEPYLDALRSEKMTAYDGLDVGQFKVNALSASQLNSYATCPRRYFMSRVLELKAPQESEEGFDAMQKGTILHRCLELFAIEVKEKKVVLGPKVTTTQQRRMLEIAIIAYDEFLAGEEESEPMTPNINHQLFLQELQKGLDGLSEAQGPLANFLDYVTEDRETLEHFRSSEFEMEFKLDKKLEPVKDEGRYFIRGFIDRIDILEEEIRIVDYKSKKMDTKIDKKKLEQMAALKDMQLALYILFARRQYGDKRIESYLQTFKSKYTHAEFAKAATYEVAKDGEYIHYDDDFELGLIVKITEIRDAIKSGDFHYDDSDEEQCSWCEYALVCNR